VCSVDENPQIQALERTGAAMVPGTPSAAATTPTGTAPLTCSRG
jgi:hypothetical protein